MKKGVVEGVAKSKGSKVTQKGSYTPMWNKPAKPYSGQSSSSSAAAKFKKGS